MRSIFTRTYNYRRKTGKNEKENYLTEIFSYCLQTDKVFIEAFLKKLEIPFISEVERLNIETQVTYPQGRPDIVISYSNTIILVECKVESPANIDQLNRYKSILESNTKKSKFIVFLSKYQELEIPEDVKKIRWYEVFNLKCESGLTLQLKKYLKDENMSSIQSFNKDDLASISKITSLLRKMDEVLEYSKKYFQSQTGINLCYPDNRRKQLIDTSSYKDYRWITFEYDKKAYQYCVNIGFTWDDENQVSMELSWWLPNVDDSNEELRKDILKDLEHFLERSKSDLEDGAIIGYSLNLNDFVGVDNQFRELKAMLKKWINRFVIFNKKHDNKYLFN